MEKRDLYRQVAQLHVDNINQGFLATLGIGFVSLMYRAIDEAAGSVLLIDERDGRVAGFVSGGKGMGPIYRRMLRYPLRLANALLPSVFHPTRVWRIFEILRYSHGRNMQADLPEAELLSIAVDPDYRGQQMADGLYQRLQEYFLESGVMAFKIVVGEALAPAHSFYRRMGAVPRVQLQVHEGAPSLVYLQMCAPRRFQGSLQSINARGDAGTD